MVIFLRLALAWLQKNFHGIGRIEKKIFNVLMTGIEPATVGLLDQCSTD